MLLKALKKIGSLRLTVVCLFILLILTIWGTLYQSPPPIAKNKVADVIVKAVWGEGQPSDYGLYQAQKRFYEPWFFPLTKGKVLWFPGARLVMTVLCINLLASMIHWLVVRCAKTHVVIRIGFILTHAGLVILLVAAALIFLYAEESHLQLVEGDGSNVAVVDNRWELAVAPRTGTEVTKVSAIDFHALKPGRELQVPDSGIKFTVEAAYPNCMPDPEATAEGAAGLPPVEHGSGAAGLKAIKGSPMPKMQSPGIILRTADRRIMIWSRDRGVSSIQDGDKVYDIVLRMARLPLPCMIQLTDFKMAKHPGSGVAKSYSSEVQVYYDGDTKGRPVTISMNKPLRTGPFTIYQSSYDDRDPSRETSVFQVVKNSARLLPYIATTVTFLGMLIQFIGMLVIRTRGKEVAS